MVSEEGWRVGGGGNEEVGGVREGGRGVRRFPTAFSTGSDNSFHLR